MTTEEQKTLLDQVKAATHGMSKGEKQKTQQAILLGICLALGDQCPAAWKVNLMVGRADRLFR